MATVINNPPAQVNPPVQVADTSGSSAGWVLAVILLILIVAGGIAYAKYHAGAGTTSNTYNTSVTVPAPAGGTAPAGGSGSAPAPSGSTGAGVTGSAY